MVKRKDEEGGRAMRRGGAISHRPFHATTPTSAAKRPGISCHPMGRID
ncbi:MAG TPA: hypothetical protein PLM24_10795 [Methanothrix sp.]|nr:hypothetical protein [Methanothrix sp.]